MTQILSLVFDRDDNGFQYGTHDKDYYFYYTAGTRNVTGGPDDYTTFAQAPGTSPHSSETHRIWEYSISTKYVTYYAPKDAKNQSIIGFNVVLKDAHNHFVTLVESGVAQLTFGTTVVPENLDLLVPLLVTVGVLSVYRHSRKTAQDDVQE